MDDDGPQIGYKVLPRGLPAHGGMKDGMRIRAERTARRRRRRLPGG